jgi:hypothetical protein
MGGGQLASNHDATASLVDGRDRDHEKSNDDGERDQHASAPSIPFAGSCLAYIAAILLI